MVVVLVSRLVVEWAYEVVVLKAVMMVATMDEKMVEMRVVAMVYC